MSQSAAPFQALAHAIHLGARGRPSIRSPTVAGGRAVRAPARSCGAVGLAAALLALAIASPAPAESRLPAGLEPLGALPRCGYEVVAEYPHRREAFTQGLAFSEGRLFEGTGLYGRSSLAEIDLASGRVLREVGLPRTDFGEGITVVGERVVQLTWREGRGFVYGRDGLARLREFRLAGEGWGLTHDGRRLLLSDGSAVLRYLDPQTFAAVGRVAVRAADQPITGLNELEWVGGEVLANVFPTSVLVRIDPNAGRVTGWLDLAPLRARQGPLAEEAVPNGIAYDPAARRLLLTGKLWSRIYQVRLQGEGCGALADLTGAPPTVDLEPGRP